jgi:hypothetical protein
MYFVVFLCEERASGTGISVFRCGGSKKSSDGGVKVALFA